MYGIRGVVSDCESGEVAVTKLKMSRTHALRIQIRKVALKSARPSMTTPSNYNFLPRNPRLGAPLAWAFLSPRTSLSWYLVRRSA
jgi:hypothetical protein